jgi:2'-5' RNA ligase
MAAESAFAVNVPEAEPYVAGLRDRFDPSAKVGVPAHITVLYPFLAPEQIGEETLAKVRRTLLRAAEFSFRLCRVEHFPTATYLAPEPSKPFIQLTESLVGEFPTRLPYGGQYDGIAPHLTVAQGQYSRDLVEKELNEKLPPGGIEASCREVVLIENSSGVWKRMQTFPLGTSGRGGRGG